MQYTLDSVVLAEENLRSEGNKNSTVERFPRLAVGDKLIGLPERLETAYYGVVTAGKTNKIRLKYRGEEFITIDDSSQIIALFTELEILDLNDVVITENIQGMFQGFELKIG